MESLQQGCECHEDRGSRLQQDFNLAEVRKVIVQICSVCEAVLHLLRLRITCFRTGSSVCPRNTACGITSFHLLSVCLRERLLCPQMYLDFDTPTAVLETIEERVSAFLENRPKEFTGAHNTFHTAIGNPLKLRLGIFFEYSHAGAAPPPPPPPPLPPPPPFPQPFTVVSVHSWTMMHTSVPILDGSKMAMWIINISPQLSAVCQSVAQQTKSAMHETRTMDIMIGRCSETSHARFHQSPKHLRSAAAIDP